VVLRRRHARTALDFADDDASNTHQAAGHSIIRALEVKLSTVLAFVAYADCSRLLCCILLYAALLRLDALFKFYGPSTNRAGSQRDGCRGSGDGFGHHAPLAVAS
jgi:hypothetical protein